MNEIEIVLNKNREWSRRMTERQPDYFMKLARQQAPDFLWIGCSDSRVPANEIVGMLPGELFVHRNVANIVYPSDLNCLSVIQYAVDVLKVRHIIVCGHYGCGGVRAAMERQEFGLIDNWLRKIKDVYSANKGALDGEVDPEKRINLLCEVNVRQQVLNVCHTSIVQNAWREGRELAIHGWIYAIADGLLKDMGFTIDGAHALEPIYHLPGVTDEVSF